VPYSCADTSTGNLTADRSLQATAVRIPGAESTVVQVAFQLDQALRLGRRQIQGGSTLGGFVMAE